MKFTIHIILSVIAFVVIWVEWNVLKISKRYKSEINKSNWYEVREYLAKKSEMYKLMAVLYMGFEILAAIVIYAIFA